MIDLPFKRSGRRQIVIHEAGKPGRSQNRTDPDSRRRKSCVKDACADYGVLDTAALLLLPLRCFCPVHRGPRSMSRSRKTQSWRVLGFCQLSSYVGGSRGKIWVQLLWEDVAVEGRSLRLHPGRVGVRGCDLWPTQNQCQAGRSGLPGTIILSFSRLFDTCFLVFMFSTLTLFQLFTIRSHAFARWILLQKKRSRLRKQKRRGDLLNF